MYLCKHEAMEHEKHTPKKHTIMKKILMLLCCLCTMQIASAATYKVRALHGNDAYAFSYKKSASHNVEITGDPISLDNGTTVILKDTNIYHTSLVESILLQFTSTDEYYDFVIIEYEGEKYLMEPHDLKFDERNNEEGTINVLEEYNYGPLRRFYNGITPFVLIFTLLLASMICIRRAKNSTLEVADKLLLAVPILSGLAVVLEIVGAFSAGGEMFWWLDKARYGMWRSLFRLIPFVGAAYMQFRGMKMFMIAIQARYCDDEEADDISIKPLLLTFILGAVAIVASVLIIAGKLQSDILVLFVLAIELVIMGYFVRRASKQYQEILGKKMGIIFATYAFIWTFGAIVATIFYIWGVLKVIIPLLLLLAIGGVLFTVGATPMAAVGGTVTRFLDRRGGEHATQGDAERANRAMGD